MKNLLNKLNDNVTNGNINLDDFYSIGILNTSDTGERKILCMGYTNVDKQEKYNTLHNSETHHDEAVIDGNVKIFLTQE